MFYLTEKKHTFLQITNRLNPSNFITLFCKSLKNVLEYSELIISKRQSTVFLELLKILRNSLSNENK